MNFLVLRGEKYVLPKTLLNTNMIESAYKYGIRKLLGIFFKVKVVGVENVPEKAPAIIIANHQSFLDALLIYAYVKRDVKFIAYYTLFDVMFVGPILRYHHDIPIKEHDPNSIKSAFDTCCDLLKQNQLVCIFPEGKLTDNGAIDSFKPGIKFLWSQCPSQILPVSIKGCWDTLFSRKRRTTAEFIETIFSRPEITVRIGTLIEGDLVPDPTNLRTIVQSLYDTE